MALQEEKLTPELREELEPLLQDHWEEIAMYQDKILLNPSWEMYESMKDSLCIFTLRGDLGGTLLAYNVFFINKHPHYQDHKFAVNDVLYVEPVTRHVNTKFFIDGCEELLKEKGVSVITYHMKEHKPFHGLMNTCEYDHAEYIYTKYVGK